MTKMQETNDLAVQLILKHAELVAIDVARAEAIVDYAIQAAAIAMTANGDLGAAESESSAKEVLQVARNAAAKVLQVAKQEAELTLRLAKSLASARLAAQDIKLVEPAQV